MKPKLFILLLLFSSNVAAIKLQDLSAQGLKALQEKNPIIIDIRTSHEWAATGIIPSSRKAAFFSTDGQYNINKWLKTSGMSSISVDQPVVLICQSGNRSKMVGDFLVKQLGLKNIYYLRNGINSWVSEGYLLKKVILSSSDKTESIE